MRPSTPLPLRVRAVPGSSRPGLPWQTPRRNKNNSPDQKANAQGAAIIPYCGAFEDSLTDMDAAETEAKFKDGAVLCSHVVSSSLPEWWVSKSW